MQKQLLNFAKSFALQLGQKLQSRERGKTYLFPQLIFYKKVNGK